VRAFFTLSPDEKGRAERGEVQKELFLVVKHYPYDCDEILRDSA